MTVTPGLQRWREPALLAVTVGLLAAGGAARLAGAGALAAVLWTACTAVAVVPAVAWVAAGLRRGSSGVDLLALLALGGTLAVGEPLAGALIAVMVATGRALESAARRRATRDLRALLDRAPRTARLRRGQAVVEVPAGEVVAGDVVLVGPGEVLPVDGTVAEGTGVLDESALTGEPGAVERAAGDAVRSGTVNAGAALVLRCSVPAAEGTYAGIVALVRQAAADDAPVVRLADRVAAWFLPVALGTAGLAWLLAGSPARAVAVLVVATPCPLLLAAPVAVVSGLSRASRIGVVVRSGTALEALGGARTVVLDKTGTLTAGQPAVTDVVPATGHTAEEVLRLAASAEQLSPHVLARALVAEARRRGLPLDLPGDVEELPGRGVTARVGGAQVRVGRPAPLPDAGWARAALTRAALDGCTLVWLEVDGEPRGVVLIADPLRPDAGRTLRRLRAAGVQRLLLLTGDRTEPAREVGAVLGLDDVLAEQTPAGKVAAVRAERARAATVMVGDGLNDAAALAAATVGVAMGARGSTASSEAADVVLTTDRIDRLADAMEIARRSRRIAVQSAVAGTGLSLAAMALAALGLVPAAPGALLQEAIDVAVILNALRALGAGRTRRPVPAATAALVRRFAGEQEELHRVLPVLRSAADALAGDPDAGGPDAGGPDAGALEEVHRARDVLVARLVPHELAEEAELYPALADAVGGADSIAPMSRAHAEVGRLTRRLQRQVAALDAGAPLDAARRADLLACLYGLHAVLLLHYRQEEESWFPVAAG